MNYERLRDWETEAKRLAQALGVAREDLANARSEREQARATIERQRRALERIALTKFAGPASLDPVAILQEIARAALLPEGDSTEGLHPETEVLEASQKREEYLLATIERQRQQLDAAMQYVPPKEREWIWALSEGDSTEPEEWKCDRCGSERWETRDIGQIYCQDCGTKGGIAIAG